MKAKMLAIPVRPQAAQAGSPRNVAGLCLIKSGKGTLLLVKKSARSFQVWYYLARSVKIPERRYLGVGPQEKRVFRDVLVKWLGEKL